MAIQLKTITAPLDTGVDQEYFIPDTASELQNDSYVPGANIKEALETINDATLAKFEQVEAEPGSIVTFEDGADNLPIKKLKIDIEPVQAGSGDPSPDNVRPISGWTGAKVTVAGKNLFDKDDYNLFNGYINTNNTIVANNSHIIVFIKCKPNTRYFARRKAVVTNERFGLAYTTEKLIRNGTTVSSYVGGSWGSATIGDSKTLQITTNSEATYLIAWIGWTASTTLENVINSDVQIEEDSMQEDYESSATTYDIEFPSEAGTVYGGKLEINEDGSGTLVVTHAGALIDGSETINAATQSGYQRFAIAASSKYIGSIGLYNTQIGSPFKYDTAPLGANNKNNVFAIYGKVIYIRADSFSDVSELKAFLQNNPSVFVGQLATPLTYSLTVPQVKTLLGLNNIWADTGDITQLIYRTSSADSAAADMIATVEGSTTAEQPYDIGDLLIVKSTLYKVTSPIATGETINPGVNCEATTVEAELKGQRSTRVPITLTASGWTNATQTVTVAGVSSDVNAQVIEPIPADNSKSEYCSKGVWCESQDANSLTFKYWKAPENDLDVNIIITEVQSNG